MTTKQETWLTKQEKRIAAVLAIVLLTSLPIPPSALLAQTRPERKGLFVNDWCRFARGAELFAAMDAARDHS